MKHCVIMAGGSGTRFWPRSRENKSKQFLKILGNESMIQTTVNRFLPTIPPEFIYIVAKEGQEAELKKHVPGIPADNFIFEPERKNTAACTGLAVLEIRRRDSEALVIVSPSDHIISPEALFHQAVQGAVELAEEKKCIVALGITPDYPSTEYGYLQADENVGFFNGIEAFGVKTFAEKPNLATANRFLSSGDFFWNSGLFVFSAETYLSALADFMPDLHASLMEIDHAYGSAHYEDILRGHYQQMRGLSIDYGIMEHSKHVHMVKGEFTWHDLGSWDEIYKLSRKDDQGNAVIGSARLLDTVNSYVYAPDDFIAVVGLNNVVVVQEGGVTLICSREKSDEVGRMVDLLKLDGIKKYI